MRISADLILPPDVRIMTPIKVDSRSFGLCFDNIKAGDAQKVRSADICFLAGLSRLHVLFVLISVFSV